MKRSLDEVNNTSELEDTLSDFYEDNRETPNDEKKVYVVKKKSFMVISFSFVILIFVIFVFFYMFSPKLTLKGDSVVKLEYNTEYSEEGYEANYFGNDITKKVYTNGKVDNTKLGTYTINYYVRKNKIVVRKTRTIKVVDTTKPDIVLEGDEEVNVCPNKEYEEAGFKATDNYDGDLTDKVTFDEKTNEKLYIVSDSSGNKQIVARKLNRVDTEKPVITLKGGTSATVILGNKYTEQGYEAKDNCDGDLTKDVKVDGTVNTSKVGTYNITYKVKDSAGNEASVTRKVTVSKSYKRVGSSSGCGVAGTIYLTFDDGPGSKTTPYILNILKKYNVKATFFVMGSAANSNKTILKREASEGHAIGIHTWTHDYAKIYKSSTAFWNEVNQTQNLIKSVTGKETKLIRFPGGASNTISRHYAKGIMTQLANEVLAKGYNYFDWNISSGDAGGTTNPTVEYKNVINSLSKSRGNVVLMHDIKVHTANAIENIVKYGINNGYKFDVLNTSINCKQAIAN